MSTDELKALLAETTPGPWSLPHLARDNVTCNCGYVFAEYGGMGSIATIDVAESNRHPWGDDNGPCLSAAKANARLIAQAPDLLAEVIALREREARLVEALRRVEYWLDTDAEILDAMSPDERVSHERIHDFVRAALAEIEKEAGE